METEIKARARQVTPQVSGEGDLAAPRMSKLGALFDADWRMQLEMAGLCWDVHVGTLSAGAAVTRILGGGNGTTIDSDQPELMVGVDAGYFLIPIQANVSTDCDLDAQGELAEIVLFADRARAPDASNASATAFTPINLLDGAGAFPGRAYVACTGNVTDPTMDELLDYVAIINSDNGTAGNAVCPVLKMEYKPICPPILAGPCQVVLCWGGTGACSGAGVVTVACVPTSYFPVS